MALLTGGTTGTTVLAAQVFYHALVNTAPADLAAMAAKIKNDINSAHPVMPGAYASNGLLLIPNRGTLKMRQGDYVMIDDRGWPILLSADTIANGTSWTHS